MPAPTSRKITMYEAKNRPKFRFCTPLMAVAVKIAAPMNTPSVTLAPPTLSASQPPSGRDSEPMRAPTKPRPAR